MFTTGAVFAGNAVMVTVIVFVPVKLPRSVTEAMIVCTPNDISAQYEGRTYAITNARLVPLSGGVIEVGTIVLRGGLIEALGADVSGAAPEDAGGILAGRIIEFMRALGIPNGLSAVGYTPADIPALVEGTLPQHRVTKLSPREAGADDLASLFADAMIYW